MYREAFILCSERALLHNLSKLRKMTNGARPIAVLKANAYGHGVGFAASALSAAGVDFFAVARLSEAIFLRGLCPHADILILGVTPPQNAPLLSRYHLIQALHDGAYAYALSCAATEPIRTHLKLDCGMGRFGISLYKSNAIKEVVYALRRPRLHTEAIFSHLPSADRLENDESDRQRTAFKAFVADIASAYRPLPTHLLASAGILRYGAESGELIRPGIALYGYPPCAELLSEGFLPVLRLYAPVLAIRELSTGDKLGYGGAFIAPRRMRIALLGIGYGDGIPRRLSGADVLLAGQSCPIVGRVCMDLTFCALPDTLDVKVGDLALVFGDTPQRLLRLADHADTIPYELLTSLSSRLDRKEIP